MSFQRFLIGRLLGAPEILFTGDDPSLPLRHKLHFSNLCIAWDSSVVDSISIRDRRTRHSTMKSTLSLAALALASSVVADDVLYSKRMTKRFTDDDGHYNMST